MVRSNVRIALFLVRAARMGHGPFHRRPNLLGVFPESPRRVIRLARTPLGFTFRKLFFVQFSFKQPAAGSDPDHVPALEEADRAADGRFRPDMTDAEATGGAGKPA